MGIRDMKGNTSGRAELERGVLGRYSATDLGGRETVGVEMSFLDASVCPVRSSQGLV